jgi:hypothetical protein
LWFKKETPFLNYIKLEKKKQKKNRVWYLCFYKFSCFFKIRFGRRGEKEQELIPNSFKHMGPGEEHFFYFFYFLLSGEGGRGGVWWAGGGGALHGSLVALGAQRLGPGNPTFGPQDVAKKLVHLPP